MNAGRGAVERRSQISMGNCVLALLLSVVTSNAIAQDAGRDFDPNLLLVEDVAARTEGETSPGASSANDRQTALAPLHGDLADYLAESTAEWSMAPGETVQGVLNRWAEYAGWSIVWDATRDYPVRANLSFARGTSFQDAVREVMKAVYRDNPTLKAVVYRNKVVVIADDGSEALL